jgi:flagellar hook-length control protein FliK
MELRDGLNTEIVRHAAIVLRQNGEGLIRLTLHPESLGNIKIKLEMADNKVAGRIVFESDEAMKAFEKEIASLEQSFKDSGFDGASLEMALSSDHHNDGNGQQWKGEEARPFFSERFVTSSYESAIDIDGMLESARGMNGALVDVLA